MKLSDFDFDLPEELIALRPAVPRPSSRLLVADKNGLSDRVFSDLVEILRPGDRLVLNNTKVIPARLTGQRHRISDQGETRARIEVTLLSLNADGNWLAMAKPAKRVKPGEVITFGETLSAQVSGKTDGILTLIFDKAAQEFDAAVASLGEMPLPPYIASKRPTDAQDLRDYQTVFARKSGAVAAPTASLHFDQALLEKIRNMGVSISEVTLHVGAGTFLPVKVTSIEDHEMHAEWGEVSQAVCDEIAETQQAGGRIIPVGTTALRLIETAARETGTMRPWLGATDIFIRPGFDFAVSDALITNFHLPKSTLLMLVSAFIGLEKMHQIYQHAVTEKYRFFSYGDSSILFPHTRNAS